jgi:WD40 repeat protein
MKSRKMKSPALVLTLIATLMLWSTVFDGQQRIDAQPATQAATAPAPTALTLAALKPIEFADSNSPGSADFSADQNYVAAVLQESSGSVTMWDATTGTLVRTFEGGKYITTVRFSPDGKTLFGHDRGERGGDPTPINVWDTATGKLLYTVQDGGGNPVFSLDSKLLMSIGPRPKTGPYKIQIWDAATGADKATITFKDGLAPVTPLVFSPDGKSILIVSPDSASIVDAAKGTVKAKLPPVTNGQGQWLAAAWSPDGTSVLIGEDMIPVLYDAKTFKEIRRFDNAQAPPNSNPTFLNFSADGKYALTFSFNEFAARLWDVQTGKLIKVFNDDQYVNALLSPDGKFVLLSPLNQKPLKLVSSGVE